MSRTPLLLVVLLAMSCQRAPTSSPHEQSADPPPRRTAALPEAQLDHPGCFEIVALDGPAPAEPRRFEASAGECSLATAPASTFKIPHALVALQTGVVVDPDAKERWDGTQQPIAEWERDHSLRTAIQDSVLWFFQRTAEKIGRERMQEQLAALRYGNADASGPLRSFGLVGGSLLVDCDEQLDFIARMFTGALPIAAEHVATVQSIMQSDLQRWRSRLPEGAEPPPSDATVWAKTGTDRDELRLTWWYGVIEGPRGRFAFVSRVRDEGELSRVSPAVHEGMRALAALDVL